MDFPPSFSAVVPSTSSTSRQALTTRSRAKLIRIMTEREPTADSGAGGRATVADLTAAVRVIRLSEDELLIAGERRAPVRPWFHTWLPIVLGAVAALTGALAGTGPPSLLALAAPAMLLIFQLVR